MAVTTKWVCASCSCHNLPSISHCTVCNSIKPTDINTIPPRLNIGGGGGGPRLKNFQYGSGSGGGGGLTNRGVMSSSASGASVSSDMIIDPDNAFSRFLVPNQRESGGIWRGRGGEHTPPGSGGSNVTQSKWVCLACTYSNWPNSKQCTMCNTLRRPSSSTSSKDTGNSSRLGKGSSGGGDLGITYGESILDYVPRRIDYTPSSPGAVGGGVHDEIRVTTSQYVRDSPSNRPAKLKMGKKSSIDNRGSQKKWKCLKCTYENWSRASKCIMCQTARNKTPSPPMSDSESPNPATKYTHHHRRSSPSPATSSSPIENANSSQSPPVSSLLHTRSLGINSNQAATTTSSPSHIDTIAAPSAVHLIQCTASDNTPVEILYSPSTSITSTSNEARQIRNRLSSSDWLFINACLGVVNEDVPAVKTYLRNEGDRARQLSRDECLVLGQPSIFTVGSTLVHLAIRYQRSDILSLLLTPASSEARKRLPSQSNPDLATSIREETSKSLKQHKGQWPCYFFSHLCTFTLPTEIRRFCVAVQKRLLDGIVDREVEKELEEGTPIINWSSELVDEMGGYLYPLWNRTAGDCLLDSVLQATWGVVDRDGTLRRALADSLVDGESLFYKRWKEEEQRQAHLQGFSIGEDQLRQDWAAVLALADQKRKSLEQIHVFALAHILRRPIVVYGVKIVKNYRGENLGFVNFEGVYLPLIWETKFCTKSAIALAYTRGHFSALVGIPSSQSNEMRAWSNRSGDSHVSYLPLVDSEGRQLKLHFISEEEIGCEERLLKQYCECHVTKTGILTAVQDAGCPHSLVAQLMDEWLDRYRRMDKRREAAAACSNYDSDN